MKFRFEELELKRLVNFIGGEKELCAHMFVDELNKILKGRLVKGASIGLHTHVDTSEIIFVLSGEGKMICDGKEEKLVKGDVHYCPKGSSHTLMNENDEDLEFFAVVPKQ